MSVALLEPPPGERTWLGMSNCDGHVDSGAEAALRSGAIGTHSAWDFNGTLWFAEGRFFEAVHRYHEHVATYSADTLAELMVIVNNEYGWA